MNKPPNKRLELTALSRWPAEVVEPAVGVLSARVLAWAARQLSRLPLGGLSQCCPSYFEIMSMDLDFGQKSP